VLKIKIKIHMAAHLLACFANFNFFSFVLFLNLELTVATPLGLGGSKTSQQGAQVPPRQFITLP